MEEELLFYQEFIKKREMKNNWVQYWVILRSTKMYLYGSRNCKDGDFCEIIWLPHGSRCSLLKRRTYNFRFRLSTSEGIHYFKCDSNLQRHRWIHMIHLASSGRSPEIPPNHINMKCCYGERSPMDDTDSSKWKNSSLENIVQEKDSIEEALEEKEDDQLQLSDEADSHTLNTSSNNNNVGIITQVTQESSNAIVFLENKESHGIENNSKKDILKKDNEEDDENSLDDIQVEAQEINAIPPVKQTWTFTFGSFRRKSSRKQNFLSRKESKSVDENDCQSSRKQSEEKKDFSARFSMDNPAFTFDDSEQDASSFQQSRIINVSPFMNE